ncbi:hypothetical protein HW555_010101 [Spodoptera exigua]|uniref:Uncharacterized protein n=1 Tax=Spodoptera exigua TaxID=7107 RepID=A0A835GBQ6_SPOEX|nr:hypothetical protein HW555_010101 [Spodoptera exigua]
MLSTPRYVRFDEATHEHIKIFFLKRIHDRSDRQGVWSFKHWQAGPVYSGVQLHLPQTHSPWSGPEQSKPLFMSHVKLSHSQNGPEITWKKVGRRLNVGFGSTLSGSSILLHSQTPQMQVPRLEQSGPALALVGRQPRSCSAETPPCAEHSQFLPKRPGRHTHTPHADTPSPLHTSGLSFFQRYVGLLPVIIVGGMTTNVVLFPDEVDDVIGIVAQHSRTGTFDVLAQLLQVTQNITNLSVASIMETSVCGENKKSPSLVSPADLLLAHHGLHDRVEPSFGGVQVARHVCEPNPILNMDVIFLMVADSKLPSVLSFSLSFFIDLLKSISAISLHGRVEAPWAIELCCKTPSAAGRADAVTARRLAGARILCQKLLCALGPT